jgi:hypothetical protein
LLPVHDFSDILKNLSVEVIIFNIQLKFVQKLESSVDEGEFRVPKRAQAERISLKIAIREIEGHFVKLNITVPTIPSYLNILNRRYPFTI